MAKVIFIETAISQIKKRGEKMAGYNPIALAEKLRPRMIDLKNKKVLLASFKDTLQEKDVSRHTKIVDDFFRAKIYVKPEEEKLETFRGEPAGIAAQKLTISDKEECNAAFLFQVAGCNLHCWYCFVDDENKTANCERGKFFSAEEILVQFLIWSKKTQNSTNPDEKLNILRISGGEVFIVPEIIVWTIEAIEKFGLEDYIYVWIDCNLATGDFYWKYLTEKQRKKIRNYKNIGFCVCYKGFGPETFQENTGASTEFFFRQFDMHRRLIFEGLDVYSYLYPVSSSDDNLRTRLRNFLERMQSEIGEYAPLRLATPPIKVYGPTETRLTPERRKGLENQWKAMKIWKQELTRKFLPSMLSLAPHEIACGSKDKT